jgi:hypothetical protein
MKKTLKTSADGVTRKTKLRLDRESMRWLDHPELANVAGGAGTNTGATVGCRAVTTDWCSVGQLVGGCR